MKWSCFFPYTLNDGDNVHCTRTSSRWCLYKNPPSADQISYSSFEFIIKYMNVCVYEPDSKGPDNLYMSCRLGFLYRLHSTDSSEIMTKDNVRIYKYKYFCGTMLI